MRGEGALYITAMTIWILFALMTGAAILAVLWPLSRRAPAVEGTAGDRLFYRDQIAEIERDQARGLISPGEAESAKAEAARRLIRASTQSASPIDHLDEPALRRRRAASAVALSCVPLLALTLYGAYGSPQTPSQPLSARAARPVDPASIGIGEAVARIESHLDQNPGDGRGWEVLAPVYMRQGRYADAVKAWRNALRILGESPERQVALGEALVAAQDGAIPAEARTAFDRALAAEPDNAKARFYLARMAEQDGDPAAAKAHYAEIVARSPAEAPWLPLVRERLSALGGDTAGAIAALPAPDRSAAIRGMVQGLAERLKAGGGTGDDWGRLVRSYVVLGEADAAKGALAEARRALAQAPAELGRVEELAKELGLELGSDEGRK